ncbi:MAG: LD-carboxypeptidase [Desulfobacteraceae bacterium]
MQRTNLKPPKLQKGEAVGVIAPAGPVTRSEIQPGIKLLESFGYKVIVSPHLYERQGYMAGDDETRLQDLNAMIENRDVKVIFCARGGYGTLRLLEKIDFDLIRMNPKIIVGYSDITALLLAIYKKTGLVTFHGTMIKEISKNQNRNLASFLDLVSSDKTGKVDLANVITLVPGKVKGTLLGGNLNLICHLVGTPFMPSLKKSILFVEEKEEPLYRIDRMMTHLRLSGQLEGLVGLIAGTFEGCGDISSINGVLRDTVSDLQIPVVSGLPVGHGLENISLPIGVQASLDTGNMILSITESCVTS